MPHILLDCVCACTHHAQPVSYCAELCARVCVCHTDDEADEGRHSSDAEDGPAKRTTRQRAKSTAAQDRQGVAGEGKGEGGDVAGAADKAPARARRTGGAAAAAASSSKAAEAPAETHNQSGESRLDLTHMHVDRVQGMVSRGRRHTAHLCSSHISPGLIRLHVCTSRC